MKAIIFNLLLLIFAAGWLIGAFVGRHCLIQEAVAVGAGRYVDGKFQFTQPQPATPEETKP